MGNVQRLPEAVILTSSRLEGVSGHPTLYQETAHSNTEIRAMSILFIYGKYLNKPALPGTQKTPFQGYWRQHFIV